MRYICILVYIIYRGGIYTPGIAFGDTTIVKRMEESGKVKFTLKDL